MVSPGTLVLKLRCVRFPSRRARLPGGIPDPLDRTCRGVGCSSRESCLRRIRRGYELLPVLPSTGEQCCLAPARRGTRTARLHNLPAPYTQLCSVALLPWSAPTESRPAGRLRSPGSHRMLAFGNSASPRRCPGPYARMRTAGTGRDCSFAFSALNRRVEAPARRVGRVSRFPSPPSAFRWKQNGTFAQTHPAAGKETSGRCSSRPENAGRGGQIARFRFTVSLQELAISPRRS